MGDYLQISQDSRILSLLSKYHDRPTVLFCSLVDKINRSYKTQQRVMLLSEAAVYNLNPGKLSLNRRIAVKEIGGVSVSTKPDNYFVIHVPNGKTNVQHDVSWVADLGAVCAEYDYVFICEMKTEVLIALTPLAFLPVALL